MKYFNLDKQFLFNFLIFFFPLSYLAGRAIVELLLFLSFVVTLIYCKKWKDYFFDRNFIIVFLSLYYLSVSDPSSIADVHASPMHHLFVNLSPIHYMSVDI